jgi:N-acetylglutamate synthase-like GNAT family acetyltransferase
MSHSGIKAPRGAEQSSWLIRGATEDDSSAIVRLHEMLRRPTRSDSVASEYFVAENLENIVGCAAVRAQGQFGYLYGLAVDKAWRRQGIGHALTQHRLDWLREIGAESAFVFAMFWNIRFFSRHGFKLVDRKRRFELVSLHQDFTENWNSRSVLLEADFLTQVKHYSI